MTERLTRAQQQEQTRQRLLEAATALFTESGFEGASIDAITERAGFTRGAFYSNFASKAELLIALSEQRMAAVAAELLPRLESTHGDAKVHEASRWLTSQEPPVELLLLVELGRVRNQNPEAEEIVERFVSTTRAFIAQALHRTADEPMLVPDESETVTTALLGAFLGIQLLRHLGITVSEDSVAALLSGALAGTIDTAGPS